MNSAEPGLLGGIEAGGTKFVLGLGPSPTTITARHTIPTRGPAETLAEAADWFAAQGALRALGIASFGPVDLDRGSPTWGRIMNTPKPGWTGCDIAGYFAAACRVPVAFDTDVNAAALAEFHHGAGQSAKALAYVTVGTGIGGGIVMAGAAVHGAAHPELGHIRVKRSAADQEFPGVCPYHGDCLEGLASGPAIIKRWGASLSDLPEDHPAHGIIADYLAQLCHNLFAITSCDMVVLGGGVMNTPGLLARIRARRSALDAGYLPGGERHSIVAPALGNNAGLAGALLLAATA